MKHMLDLADVDCRWPLKGKGADTLFCAEPTVLPPFFPRHLHRAYRATPPIKQLVTAAREACTAQAAPAAPADRAPRWAQVKAMGTL